MHPYTFFIDKLTKTEKAHLPVTCKALQYGLGCLAGIRAFYKSNNLYIFRLEEHHQRLMEGVKIMGMKYNLSLTEFKKHICDLIKKNNLKENCYIRPLIVSASTLGAPRFDQGDDILVISLLEATIKDTKLNLMISNYRPMEDEIISTKAKTTARYSNSALAKTDAIRKGFDDAVFFTREGYLAESSTANIFCVKNNQLITPPLTNNILAGITRKSIIEIAQNELGLSVLENNIDRSMLFTMDEVFLTGTMITLKSVSQIEQRKLPSNMPIAKKIKDLLKKIQLGNIPKYAHWNTKVY